MKNLHVAIVVAAITLTILSSCKKKDTPKPVTMPTGAEGYWVGINTVGALPNVAMVFENGKIRYWAAARPELLDTTRSPVGKGTFTSDGVNVSYKIDLQGLSLGVSLSGKGQMSVAQGMSTVILDWTQSPPTIYDSFNTGQFDMDRQ